jgi:hypothetical protein
MDLLVRHVEVVAPRIKAIELVDPRGRRISSNRHDRHHKL